MPSLTDEQRRVLRILTRHLHGCAEAVLLEQGFTYDQLGALVFDRLAIMQMIVHCSPGGREKMVVWMTITPAGRKAIEG
jgi:hypothetical protein